AGMENRLATPHEVRDQLDLDTLAILPGGRSNATERVRAQRFKRLANVVSLSDLSRPATIAVTSPRATAGTARVAENLAYYRAIQGERTLHMCADLHQQRSRRREEYYGRAGVSDVLSSPGSGLDGKMLPGWCATMQVLPPGNSVNDPFALFGRDRFTELVRRTTGVADLVVIETPPIIEAAEGQVICSTADRTILVIEESATRARDAAEACQLLEQVEASVLGVVIIESPSSRAQPPAERAEPVAEPAPAPPASTQPAATQRVNGWPPLFTPADSEEGDRGARR
ncbi:MAG TPA: hypothetical protein VHH34_21630, partial [Pseudonocardiaceae bacterium]|nr:hypothetical protein [Pseudonocardiaceae bacterium]